MTFALIVLFAAFLIESIGTYVSVVGLAALFASNPVIITLAIALDVGKVVTVSFLYKHWKRIGRFMKAYMMMAVIVLMTITSTGVFGYLSGEFQKAIRGTTENTVLVTTMEGEKVRLQARKEEIDKQIAAIPPTYISGRRQIINAFKPEVERINARLAEIDTQLPQLKLDTIKKNVEVGPIIYIAEAFSTTPEKAVKWVILVIIFVFDPLAIALLIAGNFLLNHRGKDVDEGGEGGDAPRRMAPRLAPSDDVKKVSPQEAIVPAVAATTTVMEESKPPAPIVDIQLEHPVTEEPILTERKPSENAGDPDEDHRPAGALAGMDGDDDDFDADTYHIEYGGAAAIDGDGDDDIDHEDYHIQYGGALARESEEDDVVPQLTPETSHEPTPEAAVAEPVAPASGIRQVMSGEYDTASEGREVITRDQLLRNVSTAPVRSSLEIISDNADVTEDEPRSGLSNIRRIYQSQ